MMFLFMILMGFCASFGFGLLFNVPKETLFLGGISGALGQLGLLITAGSPVFDVFLGGVLVAASGEVFAAWQKRPATVYIIVGIIPLVPGRLIYQTMLHFIHSELTQGMTAGIGTLLSAGAISAGIALASVFMQAISRRFLQRS
jgi:uncharacterized membrane protein YjjB (DUF3815 family)